MVLVLRISKTLKYERVCFDHKEIALVPVVVAASGLSPHAAAARHGDVAYFPQHAGLSQQEVDDHIMPMLTDTDNVTPSGNAAK